MRVREMQGTPAHLEYVGPHGRKRKKDCIYNNGNVCRNTGIQTYQCKCVGRMYCSSYKNNDDCDDNGIVITKTYGCHNVKKNKVKINQQMLEAQLLNKNVLLLDLSYNEVVDITIVADEKKDLINSKISVKSPLGQALSKAQSKIGCVFEVDIENNKNRYKLISIGNIKK